MSVDPQERIPFSPEQLRSFTDWQLGAIIAGFERLHDSVQDEPDEFAYTDREIEDAIRGLTMEQWRREEEDLREENRPAD